MNLTRQQLAILGGLLLVGYLVFCGFGYMIGRGTAPAQAPQVPVVANAPQSTIKPPDTPTPVPFTATPMPIPTDTPTPIAQLTPTPTIVLPEYTLFKDNSYEDAGTVKVIWEILVSPDVTKEPLNVLLNELYKKALAKTSGSNNRPVVIAIYAYTSEEYAMSGMGQWIGCVSKSGVDTQPTIVFNERQLSTKTETTETKFGLSEAERIRIWQDMVRAEDRAQEEALQVYPDMAPYDEFQKLYDELASKYMSELAQREGLTLEQLDEIDFEAFSKDWPIPQR
jgi:hypothetical protein